MIPGQRSTWRNYLRRVNPTAFPSGTVTFLFTDIEGSTKLAEEHPDACVGSICRSVMMIFCRL